MTCACLLLLLVKTSRLIRSLQVCNVVRGECSVGMRRRLCLSYVSPARVSLALYGTQSHGRQAPCGQQNDMDIAHVSGMPSCATLEKIGDVVSPDLFAQAKILVLGPVGSSVANLFFRYRVALGKTQVNPGFYCLCSDSHAWEVRANLLGLRHKHAEPNLLINNMRRRWQLRSFGKSNLNKSRPPLPCGARTSSRHKVLTRSATPVQQHEKDGISLWLSAASAAILTTTHQSASYIFFR